MVVLEGDDGGQIYAVFPVSLLRCSDEALGQLLRDLDDIAWPGQRDMAHIYYERLPVGSVVAGGMGGGRVTADGWAHREFRDLLLDQQIREVLLGMRERIRTPHRPR